MQILARLREPRILSWVVVAWVIFFTGCTKVGPDFTGPEAQLSHQWLEENEAQVLTSPANYRMWWTAFKDPVLDTLVQIAYGQNIPLRVAGARVFEARARLGIAIGEQYPQVQQALGSAVDIRESERAATAPQRKEPGYKFDYKQVQVAATAGWEIDFWGKFRRAVESEDANFLGSIAAYDNALVILTADVASTYVTIRTLEEQLRIIHKNIDLQKESLRIAEARFEACAATDLDVQQALAQLRSSEASVPLREASLRKAKNGLCILLGMPPSNLDHLLGERSVIPQAPLVVAVGIPADLLRRRPDIRSAVPQALVAIYRSLGGGWELREGKPFLPAEITTVMENRTNWGGLLEPTAVEPLDTWQLLTPDW